jgi:hypothetical protein
VSIRYGPQQPAQAGGVQVAREARPATAAEVWAAIRGEITGGEADWVIASYLAPGPQPRYDTPQAWAEAQATRSDPEAGG